MRLQRSFVGSLLPVLMVMGGCSGDGETSPVAGGGSSGAGTAGLGGGGSAGVATDGGGQDAASGQGGESGADTGLPETVVFADAALEKCVRDAMAVPSGDIKREQLATIEHLACQDLGITNLAGLENATALKELTVWENAITDLTPLGNLTWLEDLQLGLNQITDLAPLEKLTSLTRLGLSVNKVSSLAPVAKLTNLVWLNLDNNEIVDAELTHLTGLSKLKWLTLEHNAIKSAAALAPLKSAGCDIYHNAASIQSVNRRAGALVASADEVRNPGVLKIEKRGTKALTLSYVVGKKSYPVRMQSAGDLGLAGEEIQLVQGAKRVAVGRVTATGHELCSGAYAKACTASVGTKFVARGGRVPGVAVEPVVTIRVDLLGGESESSFLLDGDLWGASDHTVEPFVFPSPNQFDAGSCLFMANTGAMEMLLNQHTPEDQRVLQGDTDLSERFLMVAPRRVAASVTPYDLTDVAYAFNALGGGLRNRDYNFCADWVKDTADGDIAEATKDEEGAYLSCSYNWFDKMPANWKDLLVKTPPMERTLIFVDPKRDANSQWRVALFNGDTIEQIKHELRTKRAPVLVVYNHYLYWHTNVIVGYDDQAESNGCPMVQSSIKYFKEKGQTDYSKKIEDAITRDGGCATHGVFYVRDSIYEGAASDPDYDMSTEKTSITKEKYSKKIVKLEYGWARYLGNHTYTFHRK